MSGTVYRTLDGDVLDWICWRYYGRQSGAVEAVLAANVGLAERGPIYPAGVRVTLPELAEPVRQPTRLWD
jgi:phage tail protein X